MFVPLVLLALAKFPSGVYRAAEFCEKMHELTGENYAIDTELSDYPLFVSVKSGDTERVLSLAAKALRGEWRVNGKDHKLTQVKIDPKDDYQEFERQFKIASKDSPVLSKLDPSKLFRIPCGSVEYFGYPAGSIFKPFSEALQKEVAKSPSGTGWVMIRRQGEGSFESKVRALGESVNVFSSGGQVDFIQLPEDVAQLVAPDAGKTFLEGFTFERITKIAHDPEAFKKELGNSGKGEPIAALASIVLPPLGDLLKCDVCFAIPDMAFFAFNPPNGNPTIQKFLQSYGEFANLRVVDGALIAKRPSSDQFGFGQVKRNVLAKLAKSIDAEGVMQIKDISAYVADQRPVASNTWTDVMMLIGFGATLDQKFIGDYPYNVRLYSRLTDQDWALLRAGQPFTASSFTKNAELALYDVLLQARQRLMGEDETPALWPTLDRDHIMVQPTIQEQDVLICYGEIPPSIYTPYEAGGQYPRLKDRGNGEPLYRIAKRRTLTLKIYPDRGAQSVETGFTEVIPSPNTKRVEYRDLPEAMLLEFKKAHEARTPPDQGGPPPPAKQKSPR